MKSKYTWLIAVILIVGLLGLTGRGQKQTSATTSWEYASVFSTSSSTGSVLNDLGAKGWELVAVESGDQGGIKGMTYYLKRPK